MRTETSSKIKSLAELQEIRKKAKAENKIFLTTSGCFDVLHAGHVENLEWASAQGDMVIVGLNDDASVRALKGEGRPIIPALERARLLASLASTDYIFIFEGKSPIPWLESLAPDLHVKGSGSENSPAFESEKNIVEAHGGKIILAPKLGELSTTGIIKKVVERYGR